jgi:hypothetical protein
VKFLKKWQYWYQSVDFFTIIAQNLPKFPENQKLGKNC